MQVHASALLLQFIKACQFSDCSGARWQAFGKADLLPGACADVGRTASISKIPYDPKAASVVKNGKDGYIRTYKELLEESEKWPILANAFTLLYQLSIGRFTDAFG